MTIRRHGSPEAPMTAAEFRAAHRQYLREQYAGEALRGLLSQRSMSYEDAADMSDLCATRLAELMVPEPEGDGEAAP